MAKKTSRCGWAGETSLEYIRYHDEEWGVPVWDDQKQFEFLILEGAQAGLSWSTILNKRVGYQKNFANFDPQKVARFTQKRIDKILLDPSIVRNKLKVNSAVTNAKLFLHVQDEFDGFCNYIWDFVGGAPIQNKIGKMSDVPATTPESDALSKDLKKRGFKFVGSTIIYAHMQATGMVNDHQVSCFRHKECKAMSKRKK
ncbi:MAG: DNA-3-methyladenine glycosylase I [Woeseia sp.]|jgi:DNA-3-methyladenine glycosylase I|nr:DNA-3-methyladenine glycosylase I [Woeseia sp.]